MTLEEMLAGLELRLMDKKNGKDWSYSNSSYKHKPCS
jgi:hypothetical protein